MKICKRCKRELPYSEFYVHKSMGDGHLSFCKDCTRKRVAKHRLANLEKIQEYDRNRPNKKTRNKQNAANNKRARQDPLLRPRILARSKISYAVITGKIDRPKNCLECGKLALNEAHHEDYSKPLDVVWLCSGCHGKRHRKN